MKNFIQINRALVAKKKIFTFFLALAASVGTMFATEGALSGKFTINAAGDQIAFSKGNLQYQASTDIWQFAENQYDMIGEGNKNIANDYTGWIDLFGWGTGGNPTLATQTNSDYKTFTDWGTNAISNGGNQANLWRTLSADEWMYLLYTRPNAATRFGLGNINGVNGLILLPDDWTLPSGVTFTAGTANGLVWNMSEKQYKGSCNYTDNTYSVEDWKNIMEPVGAVFLPAAGWRIGTSTSNIGANGVYASSSFPAETNGNNCGFSSAYVNPINVSNRIVGISVRLVQQVKTKSMTPGIAHLSWDKNKNQWGITAYDDGDNPQLGFTFAIDGDKTTLPTSMTLSNNTDDNCAFTDMNDGSFGGTIKDAAIAISYDGTGYQYDNVGGVYYVNAKISGSVSGANGNTLTVNEPANFIKVFVPGPEEIYAVWEAGTTTLTLYYDDNRISKGGETDWSSHKTDATTIVLDGSMTAARPTSTASWFFNFSKMTAIQNLEYLNTSEVTNMSGMFVICSALTALDLSKFNTENVTNMNSMFAACSSLTSLDVSSFNTANVTDMNSMFFDCKSLTSLDVSSFNTANVTDMRFMFDGCSSLTSLDLSSFNTSNVTTMNSMFFDCKSLKTIYCDDAWNPSSSDDMFSGCTSLVGGKGTKYDAGKIDKSYARPDEGTSAPGYFTKKTATALDQVPSTQGQSTKFLRNGNLFILRGDKTYTITGQEVK